MQDIEMYTENHGGYPSFVLDEALLIQSVDAAAEAIGLRAGLSFAPYLLENELVWHENCLKRSPKTHYDPLGTPQNWALFTVCGLPGYALVSTEYQYQLKKTLVRAVLYPNRTEHLRSCVHAARRRAECCRFFQECAGRWQTELARETRPENPHSLENILSAALLALQCMTPGVVQQKKRSVLRLSRLLAFYVENVLSQVRVAPCSIQLEQLAMDSHVALYADHFLLFLSALLYALDGLREDGEIVISGEKWESGVRLCISVHNATLSHLFVQNADLQTLSACASKRRLMFTLAEQILCENQVEAHVTGDAEKEQVSVVLHIPSRAIGEEFGEDGQLDVNLSDAARAACGLFELYRLSNVEE